MTAKGSPLKVVIPAKAGVQALIRNEEKFCFNYETVILCRHSGESRNPGSHHWINNLRYTFWQLKEWKRNWKLKIIEDTNRNWQDLYYTIV